jgi:hypothetical protein
MWCVQENDLIRIFAELEKTKAKASKLFTVDAITNE